MNTKRTNERLSLLILGTLFFQISFSQSNYKPGYVIDLKKDTLHGFIDYRNWGINPNKIHFKVKIEDTPLFYKPTDIVEFGVQDEIYLGAIINSETSPTKTSELQDDSTLQIKTDTTFLQTLFRGDKCLYFYKSSNDIENFYIKQNTSFELLIHKKYIKEEDGRLRIIENKKYQEQLMFYLEDCPSIQSKIENTTYEQNSLENLFKFFFRNTKSEIHFSKKSEKMSIEIGVLAGTSISVVKFKSDFKLIHAALLYANYKPSININASLFFDFVLPRNLRKWSLNNELFYTSYKIKGTYEDYLSSTQSYKTTTEIGYSYLKMNNLLRYKYPIGHVFLFLNGGISNGFAISETNYGKKESNLFSTIYIDEGTALGSTRKYEQGLLLGAGIKFNKYSFEFRHEIANGMLWDNDLGAIVKRYHFLFGYKF